MCPSIGMATPVIRHRVLALLRQRHGPVTTSLVSRARGASDRCDIAADRAPRSAGRITLPIGALVFPETEFSGIDERRSYLPFITGLGDGTTLKRTALTAEHLDTKGMPP